MLCDACVVEIDGRPMRTLLYLRSFSLRSVASFKRTGRTRLFTAAPIWYTSNKDLIASYLYSLLFDECTRQRWVFRWFVYSYAFYVVTRVSTARPLSRVTMFYPPAERRPGRFRRTAVMAYRSVIIARRLGQDNVLYPRCIFNTPLPLMFSTASCKQSRAVVISYFNSLFTNGG